MGNLEPEWIFPTPSLALAETCDHFALRICAVNHLNCENEPKAAEALIKIERCLAAAQTSVEVDDIKVKPLRDGAKPALKSIFVVAKLLPKAPKKKCFQLVCDGPPGAHRPLFDLVEIGGIPLKGAYPPRSKVAKLPFNGAPAAQ